MMAVLAMDAYGTKGNVGLATNLGVPISAEDRATGFSAEAYSYLGQTVIAFRGTNGFSDAWYGWGGGIGAESTQAGLAAAFYKDVVGAAAFPYSTSVAFTGHSLGGGLAGLLAGLYGKEAVVFDNMAYQLATSNTYYDATHPMIPGPGQFDMVPNPDYQGVIDTFYGGVAPVTPNATNVSGWQLTGQVLQPVSTGAEVGSGIDWGLGAIDLHSIALLVITMFTEQNTVGGEWTSISPILGPELFSLNAQTSIAYSVVTEGAKPCRISTMPMNWQNWRIQLNHFLPPMAKLASKPLPMF
jgi:hypothetical protein